MLCSKDPTITREDGITTSSVLTYDQLLVLISDVKIWQQEPIHFKAIFGEMSHNDGMIGPMILWTWH